MLIPFYDEQSGGYGYRNEQGEIIVKPVYDKAEEFHHDLGLVRLGEHYGLVDQSGKIILPVEFDTIYPHSYGWVQAAKNKTEYLYNSEGELLLELPGLMWWNVPDAEGIIRGKMKTGWGALNMNAEIIIPFKYVSLGPCINGWLSFYEEGKWGWLDKQGIVIVPAQHLEVGVWSDKLWWSRNGKGYTLFDYNCNIVYDEGWTKLLEPSNGVAAVKTINGWKFIDDNFNTVLQLPPVYEWVEYFYEELAAVKRDGVWGFIDSNGKEIIKPAYRNVNRFREGLAGVEINERWGFIDTTGEMVIPPRYRSVASFDNGKVWVRDEWCEWCIDREGNDVTERKYWE